MESAAALVAEAIAEIKEVCPSELSGYEVTIASLFQTPVAQIEAGEDVATEPEPQEDSVSPSDSAALASPRASDESQILDVESTSVEEVEVDEEAIPETTDQVQAPSHQASAKSLHKQPTKPLQWLATKRGIDTSNMKRHEIASALLGQVTQDELQEAVEQTTKVTG